MSTGEGGDCRRSEGDSTGHGQRKRGGRKDRERVWEAVGGSGRVGVNMSGGPGCG
jgi:hypothetical protein